eukprot:gnl/TRDRNA2_/TRDRNA2_175576_c0_seq7.p1 gnl/TRDRNA2_/TRDRNA2_175576_c0~~gnl/TRDRNA2_/TRDRNA2_175576_c0_seq7.p1  ORF type:complete len:552 (+),score=44.13 gnl/TRDRNA2_/TRDRNA2_175576_c0_seq7:123-1778(+)
MKDQHEQPTVNEDQAHAADFGQRTGMQPRSCFRLVLLCMALRTLGDTWIAMVLLEYIRYYIVNDITLMALLETATGSPRCLLKALLFPFLGTFADRVSRKKVMVAASLANSMAALLISVVPSIWTLVLAQCFYLVGDVRHMIWSAMLRDLFSAAAWEHRDGGITGIKSRMYILGTVVSAVGIGTGMGLLWLLPNEYTSRKEECKDQRHCVAPGDYSWGGGWRIDGSLRFLMVLGTVLRFSESLVIIFCIPETLRREYEQEESTMLWVRRNWRKLGTPWNSLRVFATFDLKALISIRFLHYVVGSRGTAIFLSWYRRHELDSFTMYTLGVASGTVGFLTLFVVSRLVVRFGDLCGIWIPANVLVLAYGIGAALVPYEHWQLSYVILPLLAGPGGALAGFTPELLAKLMPPNIQATFHAGKSFLYDIQKAVFVWPWLGLLACSEQYPYPLDALCIFMAVAIGASALCLTLFQVPHDPKVAIEEGRALDAFWDTPYAKGTWYIQHGGQRQAWVSTKVDTNSLVAKTIKPDPVIDVIVAATDIASTPGEGQVSGP